MASKSIAHDVTANHDILRFGLEGVKGDIVGSHPLESIRETDWGSMEEKKRMVNDLTYGLAFNQRRDLDKRVLSRAAMDHHVDVSSIDSKELKKPGSSKMLSRIAQIRLVSQHPEVYEPCDDSFALVDALLADRAHLVDHKPMLCMEIGCGSGYVITSLAIMLGLESSGTQYFATDINPLAAETTRKTLEAHGVHSEIVMTNIASGLVKRFTGMIDVVVVNPPYVPTPEEEVGQDGITASWAGGENGRRVIDRILPVVDKLLSDKGWLYMVTLTANDPSEICRIMRERGYGSRIIVQRSTEEESLHVIKFWREGRNVGPRVGGSGAGSWLSQWSLWKKNCV